MKNKGLVSGKGRNTDGTLNSRFSSGVPLFTKHNESETSNALFKGSIALKNSQT
jgi:hypothetical protein